jgi:hypothetical protein
MRLFAKELAVGTPGNECFGICQISWLLKPDQNALLISVREAAWFSHTPS